ncbi:MAG: hypothetical protein J0M12_06805 [Deltaproteobacteria bacterium]|nr:hypothetical protein [Deltaproteobacteria bacterium]
MAKNENTPYEGRVAVSNSCKIRNAEVREVPQFSRLGLKLAQTAGYCGVPHTPHRKECGSRLTQGTPAGLPFGMPGKADDIDGATQHAPHPDLHDIELICSL